MSENQENNSDSESGRQPRDMQGLLRLCMSTTPQLFERNNSMNDERAQWLSEALNGLTTDHIEDMSARIDTIKEAIKSFETDNGLISYETVSDVEVAIDALIDYTGNMDIADDFHKIGGFDIFAPLLQSSSNELKLRACDLLSEVVQNHTNCQRVALSYGLLPILVKLLDEDDNENVKIKSLYAISCVIRDNNDGQKEFDSKLDGFSVLLRAMQSSSSSHDSKLRIKASFLISSLCRQHLPFLDTIYNMGFIDMMVALLHTEHDSSHEHILASLYALASQHQQSRIDCQRNNLGLESLLNQRIKFLNDKSEFLEELEYCKCLLQLCFEQIDDFPESER